MKTLFILAHLILTNTCSKPQQHNAIDNITYIAQSRGNYFKITINAEQIAVQNDADSAANSIAITTAEIEDINTIAGKIAFEKIDTNQTDISRSDGLARAHLQIVRAENIYEYRFDHTKPPKELKKLVHKILTLSEKVAQ